MSPEPGNLGDVPLAERSLASLEAERKRIAADLEDLDNLGLSWRRARRLVARARIASRKRLGRVADEIRRRKVRVKPRLVYKRRTPNQSTRAAVIRLGVLHCTVSPEYPGSKRDLVNVTDYFAQAGTKASSDVLVDGDGTSSSCKISSSNKAWTQAAFNPWARSIEAIGYAENTREEWTDELVDEAARWLAKWHEEDGLPLKRGRVDGYTIVEDGVVTHEDLGAAGGGHVDPGPGFPVERTIERARYFAKLR